MKLRSKKWSLLPRVIGYLTIILLTQSLIAYGALLLFASLPQEFTGLAEDYKVFHDTYRGTATLISEQLTGDPSLDQQVIRALQPKFSYPLQLTPIDQTLPEQILQQFKTDDLAFDDKQNIIYVYYGSPNQVLQMGPVLDNDILDASLSVWFPFLLIWSVISAVVFLCLLSFAFLPLWHDAISLRNTAEQLASGNLNSRAANAQSWLFKPLSNVLNDMAIKVEQLVKNSKTISHAMAHELRTPISRLRFGLTMLSEAENIEDQQRQLNGINMDIQELESLINTSLNFFQMQQKKMTMTKTLTNLKQWSESLYYSLKSFQPSTVTLSRNIEDNQVYIDTSIVNIAVNNLLLNAFKYANSKIELNIYLQNDILIIEVSDDGPGILEGHYEEVFMPFSRLDNSRTRQTGGYGLGLAYVKLIAEQHHGSIYVERSQYGGAKFILQISVSQ
ncbi:ATP-binding protein [Neisseria sp. Ec49-e6-T10]|uniref:ATP-binding protein n=1 Tax=Neisseria sp. Ec49-e6-T10 TaxID=3140744 RepID=UPI003EC010F4